MNGIATPTAQKIDEAVTAVIADGECEVPQYNDFGGVDVWTTSQAGYKTVNGITFFADGVRVATDDNEIFVIKFVKNQTMTSKVTFSGDVSAELLAQTIKGLL
jgi:hypothetical protein